MKKVLVTILISLFLITLFTTALSKSVSAVETEKESSFCKFVGWDSTNWICKRLALWEPGFDFDNASDADRQGLAVFFKYIMLIIIILLVYSSFTQAKFPESGAVRIIISILVGFLVTFVITTDELLTTITAYSALGITLVVFFPILVLGFFTVMVARKADPAGIFIQKIMWIIYSVYLLLRAGTLALGKWYTFNFAAGDSGDYTTPLKETGAFHTFIKFILGDLSKYKNVSNTVLLILVIVAIAVFYLMVWKNDFVDAWIAKQEREAEILHDKEQIARAKGWTKNRAEDLGEK